jgi:hypothetical protein
MKMRLLLLILLLGINTRMYCHGDDVALVGKCFAVYTKTLLKQRTFPGHCSRIQVTRV